MKPIIHFFLYLSFVMLFSSFLFDIFSSSSLVDGLINEGGVEIYLLPFFAMFFVALFYFLYKTFGAKVFLVVEVLTLSYFLFFFFYLFLPLEVSVALTILTFAVGFFLPFVRFLSTTAAVSFASVVLSYSLDFHEALLFSFFLAIYDYVAVHKTSLMFNMVKGVKESGASFLLSFGEMPGLAGKDLSYGSNGKKPLSKASRLEVGLGDILVSLLLFLTALKLSPLFGFLVYLFIFMSFLVMFYRGGFLAAVPYISFFSFLAFIVYKVLHYLL